MAELVDLTGSPPQPVPDVEKVDLTGLPDTPSPAKKKAKQQQQQQQEEEEEEEVSSDSDCELDELRKYRVTLSGTLPAPFKNVKQSDVRRAFCKLWPDQAENFESWITARSAGKMVILDGSKSKCRAAYGLIQLLARLSRCPAHLDPSLAPFITFATT